MGTDQTGSESDTCRLNNVFYRPKNCSPMAFLKKENMDGGEDFCRLNTNQANFDYFK
jgi:hypothetical protein